MGTRVNGVDLGAGTSVTISTATPQPLGTAAAGSTGEVSDAGHVHALPAAVAIGTAGADAARPAASTGLIGSLYTATDTHTRYLCESDGAGGARWCVVGRHQHEGRDTTCARMGGTRAATSGVSTVAATIMSGALVFSLATLPSGACILVSCEQGGGWQLQIGGNAGDRGLLQSYRAGMGTATVDLPGASAAADDALHCIAWTWDGVTVRYSWDGGAVATASHTSGTMTGVVTRVRYGANGGGTFAPDADLAAVKLWTTAVGDADLEAAALAGVAGRIPDPAGATCVYDWHAARYAEGIASQVCVRGTAQRMTWSAAPPMVIR